MSRALPPLLCAVLVFGCTSAERTMVLPGPAADKPPARPTVNLVLGPTAEHGWLAEAFAFRSTWPSVSTGYRLDETSYVTEFTFDDQMFYERLGGGFQRGAETVRTSVLLH